MTVAATCRTGVVLSDVAIMSICINLRGMVIVFLARFSPKQCP